MKTKKMMARHEMKFEGKGGSDKKSGMLDFKFNGKFLVKAWFEFVDPARAEELLRGNGKNFRKKNPSQVKRYASDMSAGFWTFNPQPIILAPDGGLTDGQHRLFAVIQSGVGHLFLIVQADVDPLGLDDVLKRSFRDYLYHTGEKYYVELAAATLWTMRMDLPSNADHRRGASGSVLREVLKKNPNLRDSVRKLGPSRQHRAFPRAVLAALHYAFSKLDGKLANTWIEKFLSGVDLCKLDPVRMLREEWFRLSKKTRGNGGRQMDIHEFVALAVKTWNAWRTNKVLSPKEFCFLQYGDDKEPFPKAI